MFSAGQQNGRRIFHFQPTRVCGENVRLAYGNNKNKTTRSPKMGKENKKDEAVKTEAIHIAPPNIQTGEIWIKGTAPLVIHKFSHKAKLAIKAKQEAGSVANKNKKKDAKNFQ